MCVNMASSVGASLSSAVACGLGNPEPVAWLCRNSCVVRRPVVISEDFLKLALWRAVWMRRAAVIGWLCWVCGYDWLDSTSTASAGSEDGDPMFSSLVWFGGKDTDPILLGEGTDTSPLGSVYLTLSPTR